MKKKAFTLIEIVMVIVVLGIVSVIGTNIITHMYDGYIKSKIVNKLQSKSEQVLDIIAKRLSYRIKDSVVASKSGVFSTYLKLSNPSLTNTHNVLEWIGYDNEGMIGEWDGSKFIGWSGFIDLDNPNTTNTSFVTSGSRLDKVKTIIDNLSYNSVNLNSTNGGVAIVFKCAHNPSTSSFFGFLGGGGSSNIYEVGKKSNTELQFKNPPTIGNANYCEHYYLAWTAYALVPEGTNTNDFNLTLKYNYRPWKGEKYSSASTKSAVLTDHVSTFRFIQVGDTIRVKLCLRDPQSSYGFCKERAVF